MSKVEIENNCITGIFNTIMGTDGRITIIEKIREKLRLEEGDAIRISVQKLSCEKEMIKAGKMQGL